MGKRSQALLPGDGTERRDETRRSRALVKPSQEGVLTYLAARKISRPPSVSSRQSEQLLNRPFGIAPDPAMYWGQHPIECRGAFMGPGESIAACERKYNDPRGRICH